MSMINVHLSGSFIRAGAFFACALFVVLGSACSPSNDANEQGEPNDTTNQGGTSHASFEWFEYTGQDDVYEEISADANEYLNPIIAGFHPDPSIVRAGENNYYVVNSSFSFFPGIPLFHSTDLVNWTQIGHVLDRPSQLDLGGLDISEGVFAPTIRYHDGTFYVISTVVGGIGNFLVTASDPEGPWSDPVQLPIGGIDPSIFFDDDGRVYITHNDAPPGEPQYDGHRALWIQEYDPEAQEMVGERDVLVDGGVDIEEEPIWIEAPHIFKVDGTYYLIAAEGGTGYNHSEVVFRSDSVRGPYEPYDDNPILTQRHLDPGRSNPVTSTGHADFVQTPNGEWWSVFLGTRPYASDHYNTGRETFLLPVHWNEDGWPVILEGTEEVPYVHEAPDLPQQNPPEIPTNGNFTVRADFEADSLAPYWNFIRTPNEQWHELDSGRLEIEARDVPLGAHAQPSFVGRRQQHAQATATTAMHYDPPQPGDKAGLAAFRNDEHYYLLTLTRDEAERYRVKLEKAAGGDAEVVTSLPIEHSEEDPFYLKIEVQDGNYSFYYGDDPDDLTLLEENADGTILSTSVAGGFVGAYFGLYAYSADS